jgi:hypothetical protein
LNGYTLWRLIQTGLGVCRIIGGGLGVAERSVGDFTTLASDWFGTLLRSVGSGGRVSTATEPGGFSVEQAIEKMMTQKGSN